MLPRENDDLLEELAPGEAAEELLARMMEARRYRRAAEYLAGRLAAEHGHRFRSAPLPPFLRKVTFEATEAVYAPARLGSAIGGLLRTPPPVSLDHMTIPRVSVGERLSHLRRCCGAACVDFDDAVAGADRVTVAVTLFALLELYKQGEATWSQERVVRRRSRSRRRRRSRAAGRGARRMSPLARTVEALLFLSPEPVSQADLAEAAGCTREEIDPALAELRAAFAPGERGLLLRELAGGWTLVTAPETEEAARQLLAKPRTPPLTPAQAETLAIVAYLQPVSRPEMTRIRGVSADSASATLLERGLIEESRALAVRRGALPDDAAVPEALRPCRDRRPSRPRPVGSDARRGDRPARAPAQRRRPARRRRRPRRAASGSGRQPGDAGRSGADGDPRQRLRRELTAGGVDVLAARQPDRRVVAVLLEYVAKTPIASRDEPS